jgi:hypothetical protein
MLITIDFDKENRSNDLISSAEIGIPLAAQDLKSSGAVILKVV